MLPLGVSSWFGYDLPLEKRLELIKQAGFSTTCLWFGQEEDMVREGRVDFIPELVSRQGLTLDNLHVPFKNSNYIWSTSRHGKDIIWRELSEGISFCGRHHIPIMVMHPAYGEVQPEPNPNGLDFFREIIELAESRNVVIALENIFYLGNAHLEYIFSQINSPYLGFCYDSSHDNIAAIFKRETLKKWKSLLVTTHLSDNMGKTDDHLIPGTGNINWTEVMKYFPKDYNGPLLLEVDNSDIVKKCGPEEFLETAYRQAQNLVTILKNSR